MIAYNVQTFGLSDEYTRSVNYFFVADTNSCEVECVSRLNDRRITLSAIHVSFILFHLST